MTVLLNQELHEDWSSVPLYSRRFGVYYFFIWHRSQSTAPPASSSPLGPRDAAMIAQLATSLPDMNQEVAISAVLVRNSPPPAPVSPGAKKFWRICANWRADTDQDGTEDWLELDPLFPRGAGEPAGDPFNADTNGNNIPDGSERHSDSDGIPDAEDVAPTDGLIKWQKSEHFLFAFFNVAGKGRPIHVNNQGKVIFERSLWKNGQVFELNAGNGSTLTDCEVLGIGDNGFLLGRGYIEFPGDTGESKSLCMVTWPSIGGDPLVLRAGDLYLVPGLVPNQYDNRQLNLPVPSDMMVNKNGKFIAWPAVKKSGIGPDGELFALDVGPEAKLTLWQANNDSGTVQFGQEVDDYTTWVTNNGILCGTDATGKFKVGDHVFDDPYSRVAPMPGGELAALVGYANSNPFGYQNRDKEPKILDETWKTSPTMEYALDVSAEGRFWIERHWGIWHNGIPTLTLGHERGPGVGANWDNKGESCQFLETTLHGWTLAIKDDAPSAVLLGLPVSPRTSFPASGLDTQSAVASDDDDYSDERKAGNKDEFWVMVPAGGNLQLNLRSAATTDTPVFLGGAGNIAANPASLTEPDTAVTLSAPVEADGSELPMTFRIGNATASSTPLKAKVMKPRVVEVSVWPLKRPGQAVTSPPSNPPSLPSEEEFENYLDGIYKPQLNVTFDVTIQAESTLAADPGSNFDVTNPPNQTQDGIAAGKSAGDIKVFVMGGYSGLRDPDPPFYSTYGGWTNPTNSWIWMAVERLTAGTPEERVRWLNTLAHEIGHVLVGVGHPDNTKHPGPAALPQSNTKIRLMHSGFALNAEPTARRLLVKAEWDEAEAWLIENIDSKQPAP